MDKNNVLLLVLLLVSEIMGAVPEKYLWVNGYLDTVCKVLKEIVKGNTKEGEQVATLPLEPLATADTPLEEATP